jgi:hypothetical protein
MSRRLAVRVVLTILFAALIVFADPASSQSLGGRVEPGTLQRYGFTSSGSGQLIATLTWDSSAAQLALLMVCTIEGQEIGYGVASGLLDRFARLESGVLAGVPCEIGVMSVTSSANYLLNLQRSNVESSTALPAMPLATVRSPVTTVIPGTMRGTVIEQAAFRLQRALHP